MMGLLTRRIPPVSLLALAAICIGASAAMFFIFSAFLQNWLYSQPSTGLVWRSLAAGAVIGGFLTLWCRIDSRNPGKYDTLLNFAGYDMQDYDSFEVVRKLQDGETSTQKYVRSLQAGRPVYLTEGGTAWNRSTSDGPAESIIITDKNTPARFTTKLEKRKGSDAWTFPAGEVRYTEEKGRRYIDAGSPGKVFQPKSGTIIVSLLLNFAHLIAWLLPIWLLLRFSFGHALGIAIVLWMFTTMVPLPVLFEKNRTRQKPIVIPVESSSRDGLSLQSSSS
jgi:hypothetical protein